MCYAYPGPRCSYHARVKLEKAVSAYHSATTSEDQHDSFMAMKEAQEEYDATPAGIKELQAKLDNSYDARLEQKIIDVKSRRQAGLDALKAKLEAQEQQAATPKIHTAYRETAALVGMKNTGIDVDKVAHMSSQEYAALVEKDTDLTPAQKRDLREMSWQAGGMPFVLKNSVMQNLSLGKEIASKVEEDGHDLSDARVDWVGTDTTYAPADLVATTKDGEKIAISLKENSQIVKNSGAPVFFENLTGQQVLESKENLFNKFAKPEQDAALQHLVKSSGESWNLSEPVSYDSFQTLPKTEKKRFYKGFRDNATAEQKTRFNELKTEYNAATSKNIASTVKKEQISSANVGELLNARPFAYYHADAGKASDRVSKIPDKDYFDNNTFVSKATLLPRRQLNALLTVKNKVNGKEMDVLVELRYSHGPFNGFPEAKTKIVPSKSESLSDFFS